MIVEMGDIENPKEVMSKKGMYSLDKDPLEQTALDDPALESELKGYLSQAIVNNKPLSETKEVDLEHDTLQQLETLGYIN